MKMGPDMLSRNVGKTIIIGCVKSQTNADLIYTAAGARKPVNAVCAKNYPKPVNTLCEQNAYFLNVNALGTVQAGNHTLYGITDQLKQSCTALLVGRSRNRFPVVTLGVFFRSYQQNHVPWGRLSL
jgi:hypothetical protein